MSKSPLRKGGSSSKSLQTKSRARQPLVVAEAPIFQARSTAEIVTLSRAFSHLTMHHQIFKSFTLSKSFHFWKFNILSSSDRIIVKVEQQDDAAESGDEEDVLPENQSAAFDRIRAAMNRHQQNYLVLFAENEKLREQLADMRKSMRTTEKALRRTGSKNIILIFWRSRFRIKVRELFDRWLALSRETKHAAPFQHEQMQLCNTWRAI